MYLSPGRTSEQSVLYSIWYPIKDKVFYIAFDILLLQRLALAHTGIYSIGIWTLAHVGIYSRAYSNILEFEIIWNQCEIFMYNE